MVTILSTAAAPWEPNTFVLRKTKGIERPADSVVIPHAPTIHGVHAGG